MNPRLLICDEPVSALDVSVQAQILNLIEELKAKYDLTVVFIAHDLGVVRAVSDNVLVMYLGKVCEFGDADLVYDQPAHPYTRALLDSVPLTDPDRAFAGPALEGDLPSPLSPPSGCRFRTRCPKAQEKCAAEEPQIREVRPGQYAACHFPLFVETSIEISQNGQVGADQAAKSLTADLTADTDGKSAPAAEESKPAEAKPTETKPAEAKAEETKPAEAKAEETKAEETKPAEEAKKS